MAVENALISAVQARRQELSASLAEGHADSFEKYNRLVGRYQGLGEALELLKNLLQDDAQDSDR